MKKIQVVKNECEHDSSELDKGRTGKALFWALSFIVMLLAVLMLLIIHTSDIRQSELGSTYISSNSVAIAGLLVAICSCEKSKTWLSKYMCFGRYGNRIMISIMIMLMALIFSFALFFCGYGGVWANILSFIAVLVGFILI